MTEHYYTQKPKSELKLYKIKTKIRNKEIEFYTASGLFSIKRLDEGSRILIENCLVNEENKVLDLGCGYGIIGLSLLLTIPKIKVVFTDINERALQLTKKNLELYKLKAEIIQSNGFENLNEKFNVILLNPPQTAGKELCFKLIEESYNFLEENGSLQIVARHNKGGKVLSEKMKEGYGNVKDICKEKGYRVYLSEK